MLQKAKKAKYKTKYSKDFQEEFPFVKACLPSVSDYILSSTNSTVLSVTQIFPVRLVVPMTSGNIFKARNMQTIKKS